MRISTSGGGAKPCQPGVAGLVISLVAALVLIGTQVWAQGPSERWVKIAVRKLDANAGRARIDLSKAKGAFRGVRVTATAGGITVTRIELRYSDGASHNASRALVFRQGQRIGPIGSRGEDGFLDSLVLTFRPLLGEPGEATI